MNHAARQESDGNHDRQPQTAPSTHAVRKTVVVVGNGMVGLRFCEKLVEFDTTGMYRVVTFCEEPRAAYDRVGLTTFFAHRDAEKLMLARREWYQEHGIELHIGDRACSIDRNRQRVKSERGVELDYDIVVLATGSFPFVPPVPGIDKRGVFVYRTIDDLRANHRLCEALAPLRRIGRRTAGIRSRPGRATSWGWKPMSSSSALALCPGKSTRPVRRRWSSASNRWGSRCI